MIIRNGLVFQDEGTFWESDIHICGNRFAPDEGGEELDATGVYVIPGLIDIHFHGCNGYDFCDGTKEALEGIARYELKCGVTSICPASMTLPEEKLGEIFETAASFRSEAGATLVGMNMEGPFLSKEKKGAQKEAYIQMPDVDLFLRLQKKAKGLIKIVTVAPELPGAMDFIDRIKEDVTVSLAHTMADYDVAMEAFEKGAKQVTHLYNAMSPFSHRAPGVVGAACDKENVSVELIADGIHCHPSVVRATLKMFGDDRVVFVSDSMRACGLQDGEYSLGGQSVTVKGKLATLQDGTIAGSVTCLMDCVRNAVKNMQISLATAVKCASVNPAKAMGIYEEYGSIAPGKIADAVLLDKDLNICHIIKEGKLYDTNNW